ncbi:MAG: SAV_2336 N-terminal domain-related protein [Prochloraceae cyanobacterium]|nr:SAV_2336 N-terminal domain-related protein [Prochloraceae cyanobacterium]
MAQEKLANKKLKELICRLNVNFDLTGKEIADVLWLALKLQEGDKRKSISDNLDLDFESDTIPPPTGTSDTISPPTDKSDTIPPPTGTNKEGDKDKRSTQDKEPSTPLYANTTPTPDGKTLPLKYTDPPSLRDPLELVKALRPLMRRVESGRKTILDEVETVKRTVEESICIPILKSETEPWLDLALVVDDNSSMVLWKHLINELKELLEHYGIFRQVRTWGLTTNNQGKITIRTKFSKQVQFKNPQELIDLTGRRLILIVSDCVAQMWFDGKLLSTFTNWTKHQPVAIVQILPNTVWLRSGLRIGAAVQLANLIPVVADRGVANRNLHIHELLLWKDFDLKQGSKIPVLTLEQEFASRWSEFLVGKHDKIMAGFVFPSASDFTPPSQLPQNRVSQLSAEQLIERFRRISSPLGRKLAGLLMAAPVITLPVVRLIQKTLLPQSQSVHVAEVFLGGLLKPLTEISTDTNPDLVLFDVMHKDIRRILLNDAPLSDSVFIFNTISKYIESHLRKSLKECVCLLKTSSEDEEEGKKEVVQQAYARISLEVLEGLGGDYAKLAEKLKDTSNETIANLNWLLVAWGIQFPAGFAFKEVLGKITKDALKDLVKDFFKDSIEGLGSLAQEKPLQKAFGQAQKLFLELVQQELEDADLNDDEVKYYSDSLNKFIRDKSILQALGKPISQALGNSSDETIPLDTVLLKTTWNDLNLKSLPTDFNWERLAKRYVRKVKPILQESDELRELFKTITKIPDRLTPISPDFDLLRYQQGIQKAYSRLRLDSLATDGSNYNLKLWKIFIPQNVREENSQRSNNICSILDLFNPDNNYKYVVILGDTGSGKSTLIQYKILEWARQSLSTLPKSELPLLIQLRKYIQNKQKKLSQNFLEYLEKGTGVIGGNLNQKGLHQWLKNRQSLVIFDGLDEVLSERERENVVIDIINFTVEYPKARSIITSRIIGYQKQRQRLQNANFRHFKLQDLNKEQIEEFLEKWHDSSFEDKTEAELKRDRLQNYIDNSPALRELAGNPLLLTMMAILSRSDVLAIDKVRFYQEASKVLLHRWENDKNLPQDYRGSDSTIDQLDDKDKQEILRQVAYEIQNKADSIPNNHQKNLYINQQHLDNIIIEYLKYLYLENTILLARRLRERLTTRSFILCFYGDDKYGFVHRSFLEFFCAWSWIDKFEKKREIEFEYLKTNLFSQRLDDDSWYETLSFTASMLDRRFFVKLMDYLIEEKNEKNNYSSLFLAAKCVLDRSWVSKNNKDEITIQIRQQLNGLLQNEQVGQEIHDRARETIAMLEVY